MQVYFGYQTHEIHLVDYTTPSTRERQLTDGGITGMPYGRRLSDLRTVHLFPVLGFHVSGIVHRAEMEDTFNSYPPLLIPCPAANGSLMQEHRKPDLSPLNIGSCDARPRPLPPTPLHGMPGF